MREWLSEHQGLLWAIGIGSVALLIACFILVPVVAVRIPADYFTNPERHTSAGGWGDRHPALRAAVTVGKNILGFLLVAAGIAMLVLPGQGVLAMLMGVALVDFPGKFRLLKWLVGFKFVHGPINWLRERRGKEPLQIE